MSESFCLFPQGWTLLSCTHGNLKWLPKRCRSCPGCRLAHRKKTIARVLSATTSQPWVAFVTLTSLPGSEWPQILRWQQRFMRYLRKRIPDLQYVSAKEEGSKTGMKHLHLIVYPWVWVPYPEMSKRWEAISGAWNVNVERINGLGVAGYITKYMSKAPLGIRKNITYSRDFPKLPPGFKWYAVDRIDRGFPPYAGIGETASHHIIHKHVVDCDCLGPVRRLSEETWQWLKYLTDHWPRASPVA